jgi:hypothetical protein
VQDSVFFAPNPGYQVRLIEEPPLAHLAGRDHALLGILPDGEGTHPQEGRSFNRVQDFLVLHGSPLPQKTRYCNKLLDRPL